MNVLIIDRDRDHCDNMRRILEPAGITVTVEPIKNTAAELIRNNRFDVIFFDPNPQNEMRPFIMGVRRSTNSFPPFIVMTHTMTQAEALKAGGNNVLVKPSDPDNILKLTHDAARVSAMSHQLADEREDFPSRDGVIAKSAFNQLVITCLDRADRHGETSFLLVIDIDNLDAIRDTDGPAAATKVAENLRRAITRTRRTSDIAGHIGTSQFCLLLLWPSRDDEPFLAAKRFIETLKDNYDLISSTATRAVLKVSLLALPTGEVPLEHYIGRDA